VEKEETAFYKVIVTRKAEIYFYELAEFIYKNMTIDRAEEILTELQNAVLSLSNLFNRGAIEKNLKGEEKEFRFLVVKRTQRADIKIIYFVDESTKSIFVTDFFPTEKDPRLLRNRNR
jgi:hypothetical protein